MLGPTATGKSALGIAIAHAFGGEIINCDSTAVYRGFDIGTDKLPAADRGGVPHHLIDISAGLAANKIGMADLMLTVENILDTLVERGEQFGKVDPLDLAQ